MNSKHERIAELARQFAGDGGDPRYAGFFVLFNRQEFYAAHDVLEDLWLADRRGPAGNFYKGLIQLAGAFVHLQKNRLRPAAALFKLAQTNLEKYPPVQERLNLVAVQQMIAHWLLQLETSNFQNNPLTVAAGPQLALLPAHHEASTTGQNLPPAAKNSGRIVIAGGSGFIGTAVAGEFVRRGYEVVVLTRSPRPREDGVREIAWDGEKAGDWAAQLDHATAVINLAGKNINCPHTPENLRGITASRVNSVNAIAAALVRVKNPPRVWVQASAVGFYGDMKNADAAGDETTPNGRDALAQICRDWELAFAVAPSTPRKITLRIGFVLGRAGGALPVLAKLTKSFLGGAVGNGRQFISWIHLADLTQMFVAAVEQKQLTGIYNAVAPTPVTNAEFMRELRRTLRRPWSPPAPKFAVKLGAKLLGSEPSLALASQRCTPKRFAAAGFQFQFPELAPALRDLCRPL